MRPTARGTGFTAAALLLLGAGLGLSYPALTVLGALLAAAVLTAVALAAAPLTVTVRRDVHPGRVERGRPAMALLHVRSTGPRGRAGLVAVDRIGGVARPVGPLGVTAGTTTTRRYELPTNRRGRLVAGPLTLHRADPFDLVRRGLTTGGTSTLWVHPRRYPARPLTAGVPRHHHDGATDDALRGSIELLDVREYVPGDEVRHLHWKATARTGRLMVRDLADPQRSRTTVLLDTRPGALDPILFEEAVDVAASLLCASARAAHDTRLVTWSGREVAAQGGPEIVRRLLDELSEVRQEPAGDDPPLSPGGGLAVVTGGGDVPAVLGWRPRFAIVVQIALGGTPDGRPADRVRRIAAADARQAVRQWNTLA